ncbi:hypothetical protein BKA62DRAFT_509627 [Auriculariales sp. MPI-PUGE-AT-0066]|nr:hypothetical protein BKA62DRAFT_509627 [Auriculariales sp. MPI-PUGE-AT-0066]
MHARRSHVYDSAKVAVQSTAVMMYLARCHAANTALNLQLGRCTCDLAVTVLLSLLDEWRSCVPQHRCDARPPPDCVWQLAGDRDCRPRRTTHTSPGSALRVCTTRLVGARCLALTVALSLVASMRFVSSLLVRLPCVLSMLSPYCPVSS